MATIVKLFRPQYFFIDEDVLNSEIAAKLGVVTGEGYEPNGIFKLDDKIIGARVNAGVFAITGGNEDLLEKAMKFADQARYSDGYEEMAVFNTPGTDTTPE